MNPQGFGIRLRALRDGKELSRAELARLVGTSEQLIGQYERGAAKPGFDMLGRLADALQVSVDRLVRG